MVDRIVSNVAKKYLNIFVKNFSDKSVSLSFLKGEGSLNNLGTTQLHTKLTIIELKEDVVQEALKIPFLQVQRAFISSVRCKIPGLTRFSTDPIVIYMDTLTVELVEPRIGKPPTTVLSDFLKSFQTTSTKPYGFQNRIVDGVTVKVKEIRIKVSVLGLYPSNTPGPWTPHYLYVQVKDVELFTTDNKWKVQPSLKLMLPKFDKTKSYIFVHKAGKVGSVSVQLRHPANDLTNYKPPIEGWIPENITLIDKMPITIQLTQRKKSIGGKILGVVAEIIVDSLKITIDQQQLKALIQTLMGIQNAAQRQDLKQIYQEFKNRNRIQKPLSNTNTNSVSSSSTRLKSKDSAFTKFISSTRQVADQGSEEPSDDELDALDDDEAPDEIVTQVMKEEDEGTRVCAKIFVKEFLFSMVKSFEEKQSRGFALEILGTQFNFISPEDNSTEKHLQLSIPFIEFRDLNPTSEPNEIISLLGPIYKEYQEDTYIQIQEKKKKAAEFTITNFLWPDFISSHPHYPDVQKEERDYSPPQVEKRVFFREANEMFRLNVIISPQHSVLEGRVNPIQATLDVQKWISIIEIVLGGFPDLNIVPATEDLITIPKIKIKQPEKKPEDSDDEEGGDTKDFSFLVEVRTPHIYIPANAHGDTDVSELILVSTKEVIITSDPQLKRPDWTEGKSLYNQSSDEYPTKKEDFSVLKNIWELLPSKYTFKLANFVIDILPSLTSPPQRIMEPLSLNFDVGINDETQSLHHSKLPKLVFMSKIEELNLHINQNQCILLLEIMKTYLDFPPQVNKSVFLDLISFTSKTIQIQAQSKIQKLQKPKKIRQLMPMMILFKLEKLVLSLNSSTNNIAELFEAKKDDFDASLCRIAIMNTEILAETHRITSQLLVKSRMEGLEILSPPGSKHPSSIFCANSSFDSPYVFNKLHQARMDGTFKKDYMLVLRYEHPLQHLFSYEGVLKGPKNPFLDVKMDGVHLGLNVLSSFQVMKFFHSRENIFDCSPMEIMNRTVSTTFNFIKKKYREQKRKKMMAKQIAEVKEVVESKPTEIPTPSTKETVEDKKSGEKKDEDGKSDEKTDEDKSTTPTEETVVQQQQEEQKTEQEKSQPEDKTEVKSSIQEETKTTQEMEKTESSTPEKESIVEEKQPLDTKPINTEEEKKESPEQQADNQETIKPQQQTKVADKPLEGASSQLISIGKLSNKIAKKTAKILYPVLWNAVVTNTELFIIDGGEQPAAVGIELPTISLSHTKSEIQDSNDFELTFKGENAVFTFLKWEDTVLKNYALSEEIKIFVKIAGDYAKPIAQKGVSFEIQPAAVKIAPEMLYCMTKLFGTQIKDLQKWKPIVKLVRKPTTDVGDQFAILTNKLSESQRAITRAQSSHLSLHRIFEDIQRELNEKNAILQSAIDDKIRLTQMLAEAQLKMAPTTFIPQEEKQVPQQQQVVEEEDEELYSGFTKVLAHSCEKWTDVHTVLTTKGLYCFTKKMKATKENINSKCLFYKMEVTENTETFKTYAPIDNSTAPAQVFALINNDNSRLFLATKQPQMLAEWIRVIDEYIKQIKEQKEQEKKEKERREKEEREKKELAELEAKKPKEKIEVGIQTEMIGQLDKSTLKEIQNMGGQFSLMKAALKEAKDAQESLQIKIVEMTQYVAQLKREEASRLQNVKDKLAKEAIRAKQLESVLEQNRELIKKSQRDQKEIEELKIKLQKQIQTNYRYKEENSTLLISLRDYISRQEIELNKMADENKKLSQELQLYKARAMREQDQLEDEQLVNKNLRVVMNDLYEALAKKEEEIRRLKEENQKLRAESGLSPREETKSAEKPPPLPPKKRRSFGKTTSETKIKPIGSIAPPTTTTTVEYGAVQKKSTSIIGAFSKLQTKIKEESQVLKEKSSQQFTKLKTKMQGGLKMKSTTTEVKPPPIPQRIIDQHKRERPKKLPPPPPKTSPRKQLPPIPKALLETTTTVETLLDFGATQKPTEEFITKEKQAEEPKVEEQKQHEKPTEEVVINEKQTEESLHDEQKQPEKQTEEQKHEEEQKPDDKNEAPTEQKSQS